MGGVWYQHKLQVGDRACFHCTQFSGRSRSHAHMCACDKHALSICVYVQCIWAPEVCVYMCVWLREHAWTRHAGTWESAVIRKGTWAMNTLQREGNKEGEKRDMGAGCFIVYKFIHGDYCCQKAGAQRPGCNITLRFLWLSLSPAISTFQNV